MEPVGYADQQRLEAQRETGAKRRVRRTAVARFPYALFPLLPPFRHSTAGALAEAWNIRGNDLYTLDPYTPSPSAQRVYGSCRFRWIYGLLGVQPFCRPLQRRTDASSAPPRGTSGYPYGSSHVASATSGAARSAPLVHPAAAGASDPARSGPPLLATCRVRLWKTLLSQNCTDLSVRLSHRCAGAHSGSVSRSRQHLSHRVRGGPHTASLPGSVPGRPPAPPGGSCTSG